MAFTINNDFAQILIKKMQQFKRQSPQVKLFLFFNQNTYMPEDTAYFSVRFLTEDMMPILHRQIVRVELRNQAGELAYFQNVSVKDGIGANQVIIPSGLKAGVYRWIAYSDWMKNFHKKFYFRQDFLLVEKNDWIKTGNENPVLSFYPEGGELVSSISNRVVVQSNTFLSDGRVVNENGEELSRIAFDQYGLASFRIIPQPEMHYYVEVKHQGSVKRFPLPTPSRDGLAMQLSFEPSEVKVNLSVPDESKLRSENLWIAISARSQVYFTAPLDFKSKESVSMGFPLNKLPAGICYATVLNERGETLAERLFTGNTAPEVKTEIARSKNRYNTRSSIQLQVILRDELDKPLAGDFTISVVNRKFYNEHVSPVSITSYLLFQSDLVEKSMPKGITGASLDLFLITQKNHRLIWKDLVSKDDLKYDYSFKQLIEYSGTVEDAKTGKPVPDSSLVIAYLQKNLMGYEAVTRKDGSFELPFILDFWDEDEIFYTVQQKSGKEVSARVNWILDSIAAEEPTSYLIEGEKVNSYSTFQLRNRLINRSFGFYQSGSKASNTSSFDDPNFDFEDEVSGADFTVKVDEYVVFPSMEELIREVIPNLQHRKVKGKSVVKVILPDVGAAPDGPLYIIDGIMTRDTDYFLQLKTSDIISIKVVKTDSKLRQMGPLARNGIVMVHTKGLSHDALKKASTILPVKGMNRPIPFRKVEHAAGADRVPDFRSTIYWNPTVKVNADGMGQVDFYASDDVGQFLILINGVTTDGRPFTKRDSIEVVFNKN